jgi:hypothetical protein
LTDDRNTLQEILKIFSGMVVVIARTNMECSFLLDRLMNKGLLSADEISQITEAVAEKMKLTQPDSEKALQDRLLDLLRKFEGPVQ